MQSAIYISTPTNVTILITTFSQRLHLFLCLITASSVVLGALTVYRALQLQAGRTGREAGLCMGAFSVVAELFIPFWSHLTQHTVQNLARKAILAVSLLFFFFLFFFKDKHLYLLSLFWRGLEKLAWCHFQWKLFSFCNSSCRDGFV